MVCLNLLLSFTAMDFISGQLISLTNPIHMIPEPTVIKLFESENVLKCKNRLYDSTKPNIYFITSVIIVQILHNYRLQIS